MDDNSFYGRFLWPLLASVSGSVVSLSFRQWNKMTWVQVVMALFVSGSFGYFVTPAILRLLPTLIQSDQRSVGGVYWVMATGSNALIPLVVKWFGRLFGKSEEAA